MACLLLKTADSVLSLSRQSAEVCNAFRNCWSRTLLIYSLFSVVPESIEWRMLSAIFNNRRSICKYKFQHKYKFGLQRELGMRLILNPGTVCIYVYSMHIESQCDVVFGKGARLGRSRPESGPLLSTKASGWPWASYSLSVLISVRLCNKLADKQNLLLLHAL